MRLNQSPEVFAYWAGIFDVAGYIKMRQSHGLDSPYIQLRTSHKSLLKALVEVFDGHITKLPCKSKAHVPYYQWCRTTIAAKQVVTCIFPYMKWPCEDARLILEWQKRVYFRRGMVGRPAAIRNISAVHLLGAENEAEMG